MQALISDLLTYSRAGRQDGNRELVDVQDVVAEALQNLNSRIEDAGSVVTFEDLPTLVADRKQLVSVFQNLISNSIKYRSATRESRITVTAEQQSNSWKFAVNDNGIGLDTAFTDRIFTIFQRLHGREEYQGTGIGLAVVKKLIERAGGNIWVESELDEGSTFTFTVNDRVADVDSNYTSVLKTPQLVPSLDWDWGSTSPKQ
jgi:light-regulated signal transduction histidine kinase (bacteriophytochrome)